MSDYGLSTKQLAVICALSSGATLNAAAEQAGVHRNTINNWRRNDLPFQDSLSHAQYDRALYFREKMEDLVDLAVEALQQILSDPNAPPSVRLKAALAILQTAAKPPEPRKQVTLDIEQIKHNTYPEPITADQLGPAPLEPASPVHNSAQAASSPAIEVVEPSPTADSLPASEVHISAQRSRPRTDIARNAKCPCGSGKKYKRCCFDSPSATAAAA